VLTGGVRPQDVFWAVAGAVTIGTANVGATFQGIVLTASAVTLLPGSVFTGQILGQTSVVLQNSAVTQRSTTC
jgi:hypothetical protein